VKSSIAAVLPPAQTTPSLRTALVATRSFELPDGAGPEVVLAALAALLHRYSGESSFGLSELQLEVSSSQTFEELVEDVRQKSARDKGYELGAAQFIVPPEIQNELARSPLAAKLADEAPGLAISLTSQGSNFVGNLNYRTDLFEHVTILRLTQHLENLLRNACENPATQISQLTILTEQERRQVLFEWNATDQPCPQGCVHELFEKQAERTPEAIALIDGDRRITYRELNQQANRLAHDLLGRGVGPEVLVGVCMEQSWRAVVGIMGILKAGGAYVPLDPSYPPQRLGEMAEDAKLSWVVTSARCRDLVPPGVEIVSIEAACADQPGDSVVNPVSRTTPDSAAYVLYTSGSTGKPKAIVGIHRSVINGLTFIAYEPDEICCLNAFLTFGFSIAVLFLPLMSGVPLVIVPKDDLKDINGLMDILERERVTRIVLATPVFKQMLDLGPKTLSKLRTIRSVGLAGAALTPDIVTRFSELMPQAKLHNGYSSSEIGTLATLWNVPEESIRRRETLIGRPLPNTRIYILDGAMNPVPIGLPGEIFVGAPHLARGYLNSPDLTAERFLPDPFNATPGARMYRSGDLGRYLPSGDIEYLGRADDQVKIRGFRVELAEIEAALCSHPAVAQAVVVPRDSQNTSLTGYIVWRSESSASSLELRRFLTDRLPDFMLPASFTPIAQVPLLASGKVDRSALPTPTGGDLRDTPAVAPANDVEAWLFHLWESVLGISKFGVCDNFFDLGGNSLESAAVVSRIEERINRRVPPAIFFKECTIRRFAAYLDHADRYSSGFVPIQIGSQPALYFIRPQMSTRLVAEKIGSHHTLIGVEIPESELPGLEPMASTIARRIREYQPDPPYYLAGWCAGGNLAFEIARQLEDAGTPADIVILFESFNFARMRRIRHWYERIRWHFSHLLKSPVSDVPAYLRKRVEQVSRHAIVLARFTTYRLWPRLEADSQRSSAVEDEALNRASYDYVPGEYTGKVVLFKAAVPQHSLSHDSTLGWQGVAPNLEIIDVPGDHVTMFSPPNVDVLASKLAALLTRL
jgi:amino acid adenylation domain-containing protein